jgi:hypothetical protein
MKYLPPPCTPEDTPHMENPKRNEAGDDGADIGRNPEQCKTEWQFMLGVKVCRLTFSTTESKARMTATNTKDIK